MIEYLAHDIFVVDEFLTLEECQALIQFAESLGFEEAPITTAAGPLLAPEIRNNTRVILDDVARAEHLWHKAKEYVPAQFAGAKAVGLNERFRFYRYVPGQVFHWHRDGYFRRENGQRSRLTLILYLNDDFQGGQTAFADFRVAAKAGRALFFEHSYLHEGCEVLAGTKYVLRTDVMYSH